MAWLVSLALVIVLVVVVIMSNRREQGHLRRIQRTLETAGDQRAPARSIDAALDRLANMVHMDESEEMPRRVQAAFDAVSSAAIVVDGDGVELLRNQQAQPYQNARHGDALVENEMQARLSDALLGEVTEQDLHLHGPPERHLLIVGSPLIADGELLGAVVLVDDISEQQRLEKVRRDFVANVSHELRTPVGALSLLAETLEGETDPSVISSFLSRIQDESTRLATLIDDLLDLSRIEGAGEADSVEVDLGGVLQESFAAMRSAAEHKNIEMTLEVFDDATVIGDRSQLVSAASNLLGNAIKYTDEGGSVSGRIVSHGTYVAVVVSDTGIGIPQKDLNRVFERFYRVDGGRGSKTGGTGLGLSIVRNVAVNHGGRVEVTSQEGVGSTFSMILPVGGPELFEREHLMQSDSE